EAEARRNEEDAKQSSLRAQLKEAEATEQKNKVLAAEASNRRLVYAAQVALAGVAYRERDYARASEFLRDTLPAAGEDDPRGWEWPHLFRLIHSESRVERWPGLADAVAFDVSRVVLVRMGETPGRVEVIDAGTGKPIITRPLPAGLAAVGELVRFP